MSGNVTLKYSFTQEHDGVVWLVTRSGVHDVHADTAWSPEWKITMTEAFMKLRDKMLSEQDFNDYVLDRVKKGEFPASIDEEKSSGKGVKEYPILEFDDHALELLHQGVVNTQVHSRITPAGGRFYEFGKRAFDIVASSLALLFFAIPIGVLAVCIYAEDAGNPFFAQVRLTKGGKPFKMYKLRTMCMDAEERFAEVQKQNETDGLAFKSKNDPRVTKIGEWLRKTSLDELPQFLNTLKGDMSIIGPRPPLPREVVLYTPEQMDRLLVKGGISCICQTEGRSDTEFDKWVEGDVEYIQKRSFKLDLTLMLKTVKAVIQRKGAR